MSTKIKKAALGIGIGATLGFTLLRDYKVNKEYYTPIPLTQISKELEQYDKFPKNDLLSKEEALNFLDEINKDPKDVFSNNEASKARLLIRSLFEAKHFNTIESGKNLDKELRAALAKQGVTEPTKPSDSENSSIFSKMFSGQKIEYLSYSDFLKLAFPKEGPSTISRVVFEDGSNTLNIYFHDDTKKLVLIPSTYDGKTELANKLAENSIAVVVLPKDSVGSSVLSMVYAILPFLLIFLFLTYMSQRGQRVNIIQANQFGSSKIRKETDSKVTFSDVAGVDEAKQELQEVVDFLKTPLKYVVLGAKIPKGVLLLGPPGCGKTLLARAVAGEAGVPFFHISASEFVEIFVGVGASRVRNTFNLAKQNRPCVVFIDEIDAVGRQRGAGFGGGHDEREQTLNQLLVEMDGFESFSGIIVLAATNRPDILDAALLRPGRFDRRVLVDMPDVLGREKILHVHSKGKPLASDVNLKVLAQRTPGFTGADLANLLNEAAILAAKKNKNAIYMEDLEQSIDKVIAGPEKKSRVIRPKDKLIIAYHEVGHALVAFYDKDSDPLHKVSTVPRGMALGLTWTRPEEDHLNYTKSQLLAKIKLLLAGRIAEEIVFEDITTGARNDLERVTDLAKKMVTQFGMSEKLGPRTFGKDNEHVFLGRDFGHMKDYSEEIAARIDTEINQIINKLYNDCKALLISKRKHMDAIVQVLLEKETIEKDEFESIIRQVDEGTFVFK